MSLFRQRPRKPAPLKVRRAAYLASRSITEQRPTVGRWIDATSQPPRIYETPHADDRRPWGHAYGRRFGISWVAPPEQIAAPPSFVQHEHVHHHGIGFGTGFSVGMGWLAARIVITLVLCLILVTLLAGASRAVLP